ncbi:transmembrane protein [Elysia marginata]|uniref:Transmembrane protein n=1 Tax=Elysia marginata TaxID=1093978 RepID=A0AAV4FZV0_9GAST|nr:transmembrane protein [Elysia marginata]
MAPKALGTMALLAKDYVSYYKAIFARTLFGTHAVVTVWRTTVLMGVQYWALSFGVVCLCVEYIVTMWANMGEEWPWISPSTLCYLATVGSSLWVQKLQSLGHVTGTNGSSIASVPSTSMELDFSPSDWLLLTEQTMMVTIILSRWLLPKGEMTHTGLSSLLLLYLGLSADILDFSTIFNEPKVAEDEMFCYVLLVVWTGSLFQFFLVLTNTKKADDEEISCKSIVCSSEVWQILVQVGLQDLPFLIVRLTVMLNYQVFNYTIIFFVCKNSLVIALEVNHMIGLCQEQRAKLRRRQARIQNLKNKLNNAKNKITRATKGPFSMRKLRELGQNNGKTGDGNTLALASAAFATKGDRGQQAMATSQHQTKLVRLESKLSAGSDDGYATAADGSPSRTASLDSFDKTPTIEHTSEPSSFKSGNKPGNVVYSSRSVGTEGGNNENGTKSTKPNGIGIRDSGPTRTFKPDSFARMKELMKAGKPGEIMNDDANGTQSSNATVAEALGARRNLKNALATNPRIRLDSDDSTFGRGTPPSGHFLASSDSTFSLMKINTTDSSAIKLYKQ